MNRGMVSVADLLPVGLLADLREQERAKQAPKIVAPKHEPPRVIGDPVRTPVNRQAAMMTAKVSWLYQPFPAESEARPMVEKLIAEIQRLKHVNACIVEENNTLRAKLKKNAPQPTVPAPQPKKITPEQPKPSPEKIELLERLSKI